MSSLNKVMILGRLGQDPESKTLPTGTVVCNMTVATSEKWMKDGNKQEKTEWHRVNIFGSIAENCAKYLTKGSQVFVEGKIGTRSWDDKDGKKRYSTEITATSVTFLGTNKDRNEALQTAHNSDAQVSTNGDFASDSIPF